MGLKYHTVIFVPHARAKLRKWRVTNRQIAAFVCTVLTLTVAAGFITWSYFTTSVDLSEVDRLKAENESLRQVNHSFESSIRSLQDQLTEYEERTQKLAIVAGLDNLSTGGEAGIGGSGTMGSPLFESPDLASLESRALDLSVRLSRVEDKLDDRLQWISATPAIRPVQGIYTSGFGYRRDPISGKRAFHNGIDLSASPGKSVHATADGIVMRAGRVGSLGRAVYLAHGYGVTTRYGHLSRIEVEPGQKVKRGDLLGYVGNSGRTTGFHLHYEVRQDGKAMNPMIYILDRFGRS